MPQQIVHLKREEINDKKWDACISAATNGTIYSYTFYLDAFADNWDALVLNNYEAVMPLPWRKKWNFCYLYQPFLTAQTGVTGNNIMAEKVLLFLNAIPEKFTYVDVQLNAGNVFYLANYKAQLRSNFVLNINTNYESIYKNYRQHIKRSLKKAINAGCAVKKNIPVDRVIELAKKYTPAIQPHVLYLDKFKKLYHFLQSKNETAIYGVYDKDQKLMSSAVFFFSHNRAYYILVGNNPQGKQIGASQMLIDTFIKDYSNDNLILDFEGSDLPGLYFFYSSFGATDEKYPALKINRLPFYAKWLK